MKEHAKRLWNKSSHDLHEYREKNTVVIRTSTQHSKMQQHPMLKIKIQYT